MFTVEFESDYTHVVSMDGNAKYEDAEMLLTEDGSVFIRQWNEEADGYDVVCISYQQLLDIITALNSTVGMFIVERKSK